MEMVKAYVIYVITNFNSPNYQFNHKNNEIIPTVHVGSY